MILTKADGDARGGAALSVRQVTGKPIKFIGVGEKVDALEPFHPDRIASRILGMGDVMSLIEQAEQKIDKAKAEKLVKKVQKGQKFDLEDLKEQFQQMKNMGGMGSMLDKLPGMGNVSQMVDENAMGKQFGQMEAIINSMTPAERRNPDLLNGSRKRRIIAGSGTQMQDLNRLLKQHKQMAKMMKKMKGGGMAKMMRGLGGMMGGGGGMPPGGMPPGGGLPPGFGRYMPDLAVLFRSSAAWVLQLKAPKLQGAATRFSRVHVSAKPKIESFAFLLGFPCCSSSSIMPRLLRAISGFAGSRRY